MFTYTISLLDFFDSIAFHRARPIDYENNSFIFLRDIVTSDKMDKISIPDYNISTNRWSFYVIGNFNFFAEILIFFGKSILRRFLKGIELTSKIKSS